MSSTQSDKRIVEKLGRFTSDLYNKFGARLIVREPEFKQFIESSTEYKDFRDGIAKELSQDLNGKPPAKTLFHFLDALFTSCNTTPGFQPNSTPVNPRGIADILFKSEDLNYTDFHLLNEMGYQFRYHDYGHLVSFIKEDLRKNPDHEKQAFKLLKASLNKNVLNSSWAGYGTGLLYNNCFPCYIPNQEASIDLDYKLFEFFLEQGADFFKDHGTGDAATFYMLTLPELFTKITLEKPELFDEKQILLSATKALNQFIENRLTNADELDIDDLKESFRALSDFGINLKSRNFKISPISLLSYYCSDFNPQKTFAGTDIQLVKLTDYDSSEAFYKLLKQIGKKLELT